jgi:hypothetical protein
VFPTRWARFGAVRRLTIPVVAAFFALAGCGGDGDSGGREQRIARGEPDPEHVREVARDPYLVTCADIAAQPKSPEASRLVIQAEFALAQVPELRGVVARETLNRTGRSVYYGLTEECRGRPPSFEPARAAVAGVLSGKYRAARNRPG